MAEENAFVRDLAKAQAEMDNALFDKVNPHFKSKYSSLAAVRAAIKPLSKHGFAIVQTMRVHLDTNGHPICMLLGTRLEHISGETRLDERLIAIGSPQQMGSEETYARRRGLSAVACIASEEDDDAEGATIHPLSANAARQSGFYPTAEAAMRNARSKAELRDWWKENQDDIRALPPHWRAKLEGEKERAKQRLGDNTVELTQALKASLALTDEEKEIIDPVDNTDIAATSYLDNIDSMMAGAKDEITLKEIKEENAGIYEHLSPANQDKAEFIYQRHARRIQADTAVKALRKPN